MKVRMDFARSVVLSSIVAVFLMFVCFVAGFWLGVHTFRDQLRKNL